MLHFQSMVAALSTLRAKLKILRDASQQSGRQIVLRASPKCLHENSITYVQKYHHQHSQSATTTLTPEHCQNVKWSWHSSASEETGSLCQQCRISVKLPSSSVNFLSRLSRPQCPIAVPLALAPVPRRQNFRPNCGAPASETPSINLSRNILTAEGRPW